MHFEWNVDGAALKKNDLVSLEYIGNSDRPYKVYMKGSIVGYFKTLNGKSYIQVNYWGDQSVIIPVDQIIINTLKVERPPK